MRRRLVFLAAGKGKAEKVFLERGDDQGEESKEKLSSFLFFSRKDWEPVKEMEEKAEGGPFSFVFQ